MIETVLEWAAPLFDDWGYVFVATAILLERALLLGLVAPGDVVLAAAGMFAAQKSLDLRWVVAIALGAGWLAGAIGYWLGRSLGRRFAEKLPFSRRLRRKIDDAEGHFRRHGGATVVLGRFVPGIGPFVPFVAGAATMPYRRFAAYDLLAVAAWVTVLSALGYFFGRNVEAVDRLISRFGWASISVFALVFAAWWVIRRRHRDRRRSGNG